MADLNSTPSGERVHIGFFGVRNAGKSSVVNAVTGQELSLVSDTLGTTTDPVRKAMELLPLGPVVIIDTPGIDDAGELGEARVRKAREVLRRCDIAVLVVDATVGFQQADRELLELFAARSIPCVVAFNKCDLCDAREGAGEAEGVTAVQVSALTGEGIHGLKEAMASATSTAESKKRLISDLISPGDVIVLVVPIDESAPRGRLILPQQMTIRDILDTHASAVTCQPEELPRTLASLAAPPRMVVTDSQVFERVAADVPDEVPLTSFSILMARYKGSLPALAAGAAAIAGLSDESRVLIAEGCTHHRQCKDIGTVKMPDWIRGHSGANPRFEFVSGNEFPDDVSAYDLVVHCGGCMLNDREMAYRMAVCADAGVPIVNYGMAIAEMHGILERSLRPFA